MKKQSFLPDHRYLNTVNIKFIKPGDILEWGFNTELNGYKREKVAFNGVVQVETCSNWEDTGKTETRVTTALDVTYDVFDWGRQTWAHLRPGSNRFRIWCNGFNPLRVLTINGRSWDALMIENGMNILSEQDQKNNKILSEVEQLKKKSSYVGRVDWKEVYQLHRSVAKTKYGYESCICATATTAFANIISPTPRLVASYPCNAGNAQRPFFKEIKGIAFSTSERYYNDEQQFIFLTESHEEKIAEIKSNIEGMCVKKHNQYLGEILAINI